MQDMPPILVVDNQPDMRAKLEQRLNRVGFPVESASDGSQALDMFQAVEYSMVIADEQSSGGDGMAVLNTVKKISPQVPVIIMTAQGSVHHAVAAMQAGACDYILKPFSFDLLEKTVKKAIGSGTHRPGFGPGNQALNIHKAGKEIITRSPKVKTILKQAQNIASSSATVLIQGESGTGKELLAAFVHNHSRHPEAPYVAVNCAALPDTLGSHNYYRNLR